MVGSRASLLALLAAAALGLFGGVALPGTTKGVGQEAPAGEQQGVMKPGEVLLKLKPGVPAEVAHTLAARVQGRVAGSIPEYRLYLITFPAAADEAAQKEQIQAVIRECQANPQVEAAFPHYRVAIPPQPGPVLPRKPR